MLVSALERLLGPAPEAPRLSPRKSRRDDSNTNEDASCPRIIPPIVRFGLIASRSNSCQKPTVLNVDSSSTLQSRPPGLGGYLCPPTCMNLNLFDCICKLPLHRAVPVGLFSTDVVPWPTGDSSITIKDNQIRSGCLPTGSSGVSG